MKLSNLYFNWLELHVPKNTISERTYEKYIYYGKSMEKYFDDINLSEYTPEAYQIRLNRLGETVGRNWLKAVHHYIHESLIFAEKPDFTRGARLNALVPKQPTKEKYIHSIGQYELLLRELHRRENYKSTVNNFLIYSLLRTGLRYAEAIAVTWEDIDFDRSLLYTYRRFSTLENRFVHPKTEASIRFVPLGKDVIELLHRLKKLQDESLIDHEDFENPQNFIFAYFHWKGIFPGSGVVGRWFKNLQKGLGISPLISTKGTRHTFCSVMLQRNVDKDVLAKILGHRDLSMLPIYGHPLDEKLNREFGVYKDFEK